VRSFGVLKIRVPLFVMAAAENVFTVLPAPMLTLPETMFNVPAKV